MRATSRSASRRYASGVQPDTTGISSDTMTAAER
jgi:hypothetical protein